MARVGRFRPRVLSNVTGSFSSEQKLVNCDTVDSACNSVFVDNGFVVAEYDPCTEASYMYITIKGIGKASSCTVDRPGLVSIVLVWCVDRFTRHALPTLRSRSP